MKVIRYNDVSMDAIRSSMLSQSKTFVIERKSGNRSIFINGHRYTSQRKKAYMKEVNSKTGRSIIGNVRRHVNDYVRRHKFNIKEVELKHKSTMTYKARFKDLPDGQKFYYVDIKHCYWRIAYLIGVIPKGLYNKYRDDYKLTRNIALSTLVSQPQREYYIDGELINTITCENDIYKKIYKNIRYTAYNNMGSIFEAVNDHSLGYHIDGIYVLEPGLAEVRRLLKNRNYPYRTINCEKLNDKEYRYGEDEVKTFR